MAAIITRRKWLRQPAGAVLPDLSSPLLKGGLRAIFRSGYGGYAPDGWSPTGTQTVVDDGIIGAASYVDNTHYFSQSLAVPPNAPGWTIAGIFGVKSGVSAGNAAVGYTQSPGTGSNDRAIQYGTGGSWAGYVYDGAAKHASGTTVLVDAKLYNVVVTCTPALLSLYVNGVLEGSTAVSNSGYTGYTGTPSFCVGNANAGSGGTFYVALALLVNSPWTAGDVASFAQNPWQVLQPRTRRLYFAAHSGTSFSGTPGLGSLVKTGKINGLVIGYEFVPTVGSIVKTGKNPALTRAFNFAPGVGSMVKTGEIPTLTRRFNFAPGVGSIPKTGEVPTLTVAFKMQPAPGAMIKTGHAPLLYAPFYTGAGSMVKTGYAPTLTISGGPTAGQLKHSWFVKGIGVKTKGLTHSQVDSDSGDTP